MVAFLGKRMADLDESAKNGALFPCLLMSVGGVGLAAGTYSWKKKFRAPGRLAKASLFFKKTGSGTFNVDILKNGVSVLAATHTLTDATTRTLSGLGLVTTTELRNFNTLTDTNRRKLEFDENDEWTITVIGAVATSDVYLCELEGDIIQRQLYPNYRSALLAAG